MSVLVGSGAQLLAMAVLTLTLALCGFLSPANRGWLMIVAMLSYVGCGVLAGYVATRTSSLFDLPQDYKATAYQTGALVPGVCFGIFFLLNLLVWGKGASGAVPFGSMLVLLLLWFGVSVPLNLLGAKLATNQPPITFPVRVSRNPRPIPVTRRWYYSPFCLALAGGFVPFTISAMQVRLILSSIWNNQFYYMFGFFGLMFLIFLITVCEMCILTTYVLLNQEDYRWWWYSFWTGASVAVYLLMLSLWAGDFSGVEAVSVVLYVCYAAVISGLLGILCGTVSFLCCFKFVKTIYGSVKID